jgi:hypothetical protein
MPKSLLAALDLTPRLAAVVVTPLLVTACIPPGMGGGSAGAPSARRADVSESGPGPQTALEYAANARDDRCAPSCYKPEPADALAPHIKGCGYTLWLGRGRKLGEQSWAKLDAGAFAFADSGATAVPCDAFPAPQAEWKKEISEVRAQVAKLGPRDVVIVEPAQRDWGYETNDREEVVARTLRFRVYQHDVETRANPCAGGKDPLVFCEQGRSQVATAMNAAAYHLTEAEKLAKAGKKNACRQAAWDAVAYVESAKQARADGIDQHRWTPGARYELRDGKILDEKALFEALDQAGASGVERFHACGGTGDPPLRADDRYRVVEALRYQPERGPDGVVRAKVW